VTIFIFVLGFAQDCDKANFAAVDCDSYDFTVTINQTCFDQGSATDNNFPYFNEENRLVKHWKAF